MRTLFLATLLLLPAAPAAAQDAAAAGPQQTAQATAAVPVTPAVPSANQASDFQTVYDLIAAQPRHQRLAAALRDQGISATLEGNGVYTVFAPEDSSLATLSAKDAGRLGAVLRYHVVPGYMAASEMVKQLKAVGGRGSLRTLEGELLVVALDPAGKITVSDRDGPAFAITQFDQKGFNGIVHSVAGVAVPPVPKKK